MQVLETVFLLSAGVGLILGVIHGLIWTRLKGRHEFLFAALMSFSAGIMALSEVSYLGRPSLEDYQWALKIQNGSVGLTLICIVWFVQTRLETGRAWLAWVVTASWGFCIVINFSAAGGITFSSLDALIQRTTPWDEAFNLPSGVINPLKIVTDITTIMIVGYVLDAALRGLRQNRKTVLEVCVPILFFLVVAGIHTPMVDAGHLQTPYVISIVFVAISLSLAIGLVNDIAGSANFARQLELERRRWDALLEAVELIVVRLSADGRIAYVNPFLEKQTGMQSHDLISKDLTALFDGATADVARDLAQHSPPWTSRSDNIRMIKTAGNNAREVTWFSVALETADGKPDGMIAFGQDITEKRKAEAERDASLREIDKLSRALTMGELASTISHELSQPISAILSNAQTLELLNESGAARGQALKEVIADILQDTRRARDLMQRVRSFVYNKEPQDEWFDPETCFEEVVSWLKPDAIRRRVDVQFVVEGLPPRFFGVPLELQQMLLNLILNAIQEAGQEVQGRVQVRVAGQKPGELILSVEDNGKGLPAGSGTELFDPFYTKRESGTGIGLAVVKRVVDRHGGHISIANSKLGGAHFTIILPIRQAREEKISA